MKLSKITKKQFYTYLKLQGSQTVTLKGSTVVLFYTYLKLQGSQTWIRVYYG